MFDPRSKRKLILGMKEKKREGGTYVQWTGVRDFGGDNGLVLGTRLGSESGEDNVNGAELLGAQGQVLVLKRDNLLLLEIVLDTGGSDQVLGVDSAESRASAQELDESQGGGGDGGGVLDGDLDKDGGVLELGAVGQRGAALVQDVLLVAAVGGVGDDLVIQLVVDLEEGGIVD